MSSVKHISGIPTAGKSLIILAVVDHLLQLRVFDGDGKPVVDTNEKRLMEQRRPIQDLRKQLESLWPPHELTESEEVSVRAALASIVGHTPHIGMATIQEMDTSELTDIMEPISISPQFLDTMKTLYKDWNDSYDILYGRTYHWVDYKR